MHTQWQTAVALSNIAHSSSSPVVAFVGPNATPIVAWVEKKLTEAEAAKLGDDYGALLNRQEIAYRLYIGGVWQPVVYLTNDQLGDGLPALAGGTGGAVLAWTRDTDGNATTTPTNGLRQRSLIPPHSNSAPSPS